MSTVKFDYKTFVRVVGGVEITLTPLFMLSGGGGQNDPILIENGLLCLVCLPIKIPIRGGGRNVFSLKRMGLYISKDAT